ncbi:hypothetical protein [Paenibacillus roseipurpureus]|uniref:Uncharacterized protein n=1 Tax=Paenibacillus roseopurpureus TaxID=2918901 RepID=A0AA96RL85_9BACL|nr:hypothetical protein [Paenibacillus sp. MBLB1832]WNR42877.1 hypothetical protein MJB10_17350 [Paenibacillus sp. MBLB1832]
MDNKKEAALILGIICIPRRNWYDNLSGAVVHIENYGKRQHTEGFQRFSAHYRKLKQCSATRTAVKRRETLRASAVTPRASELS